MRTRKHKNMSLLKQAALGGIASDLTIKNVNLFNVITGEIYPVEVDVCDGFIVRVREEGQQQKIASKSYYDGQGNYLVPGFIDTHVHVESTMMIPENLSRAILPWGTTTICTDPHEIGNVMGVEGIKFMLENAKNSKLRQYVLAPSCVPAVVGLEEAGAAFTSKEVAELLDMDDVVGIAEVMDYVNVIHDEKRMHDIVEEGIKRNMFLQGHCPHLMDEGLAAYLVGGPNTCHESATAKEVKQKIRNGMHINLRSSSLGDGSKQIAEGLKGNEYYDFVSICTDDVHAKDLLTVGHINHVIEKYIEAGLDGKALYKMATLNAAREYGFNDLGAIAPGYIADMQIVKALDGSCPVAVFVEGQLVGENGKYVALDKLEESFDFPNTVNIPQLNSADDFKLYVPEGYSKDTIMVNVMVSSPMFKGLRHVEPMELPVKNGAVDISGDESLIFVCNANRYGTGNKTIAVYKDLGLHEGALASTIAHDSHNMNIVYKRAEDGYLCAKKLKECSGGICIVKDGKANLIELPIAGLMSQKPCAEISKQIEEVQKILATIADSDVHVLSTAVMSLTVIPGIVISDLGLVDGVTQSFVSVFTQ